MKVVLELDGKPHSIEVDLARGTARAGEHTYPVKVLSESPARVEVEIAGERVVVEGWYEGVASPSETVTVNGERFRVKAETLGPTTPVPTPSTPAIAGAPRRAPVPAPSTTKGAAIAPPMPGRVVELRVANGDRVMAGQVLLVLEAMKMRNEIVSPSDGVVADITVSPGANVRARETMLVIAPA